MGEETGVRSVEAFELDRYLGLWYELGRLPLRFEDDGAVDVTAEYRLREDGAVEVDNRCIDAAGEPTQALGRAEPDPEHPGRLRVSFLPAGLRWIPFTHADYWVLALADGYGAALVGTPDRRHLWLLSREPRLDPATAGRLLAVATAQGYALERWIETPQSGGRVDDARLEEA
ncbi:lipocalin family protein [Leucobacter allii]|uniref:lipocalin family protein n=1 Tax=Leucobacter allii TaxID=2932247 RepID=UPI001FD29357|nr:lipocalin family protein [Leucobacter allii]UOR03010.1 lipocalin family protein [Leucobacter allii]